ncbi:MAG: glycosyltransferase family 4 protein [Bacteroidales bacterium]|nr:glycosyltransferase family 4 protein [Bacteroidales bacterium]
MKKLLLVSSGCIHTYNFYKLIADYFNDILLITDKHDRNYPEINHKELVFSLKNPFKAIISIKKIRQIIKEYKPDIIHIHQAGTHALLVQIANSKAKVPIVLTAWGSDILYVPNKNFLYKTLAKYIIRHSDFITSDSAFMGDEIKKIAALVNKEIVIANFGIDIDIFDNVKENIIYSNRLHKKIYRIDLIIKAFAKFIVNRKTENWRLIIAGDGEETVGLKELVKAENISDLTEFAGWVDKKTNLNFYNKAKIYISIPETDATSISLLEAMAAGCIPVVSDLPANREWIKDMENGIIVKDLSNNFIESALLIDENKVKLTNRNIINSKATKAANKILFTNIYDKAIK